MDNEELQTHQLAHDLKDTTRLRSKDVELENDFTFNDFLLARKTLSGLERCGFERPSPIQLDTIPLGRCGFDLVVQSKAGTGKTVIFALVALEALGDNPNKTTQTLVIAPTREIAIQIHEVIQLIGCAYEDLNCCLCIGGVKVEDNRKELNKKHCQIVIGTPGRVKQLIELNILKSQNIELFVLDEADNLMDEQFKGPIDEIYKRLPSDKQMIVTSATYPNELAFFLQQYMRAPKFIRRGDELSLEAIEEFYVDSKAGHSAKKTIDNKIELLKLLLNGVDFTKCFVFTNFQARAPIICDNLNSDESFVEKHGQTDYICAELPQNERIQVFNKFKSSNEQRILISTDLSARGIDIHDIELVINLDLPFDRETYYHRIGRAGRFGQPGKAISIVSSETMDQAQFQKSVISDKLNKLCLPTP